VGDGAYKDQRFVGALPASRRGGRLCGGGGDGAARGADGLDHDRRNRGGVLHLDDVADEGGTGNATIGIAFAEWTAIAGRREDVGGYGGEGVVGGLAALGARGR